MRCGQQSSNAQRSCCLATRCSAPLPKQESRGLQRECTMRLQPIDILFRMRVLLLLWMIRCCLLDALTPLLAAYSQGHVSSSTLSLAVGILGALERVHACTPETELCFFFQFIFNWGNYNLACQILPIIMHPLFKWLQILNAACNSPTDSTPQTSQASIGLTKPKVGK